MILAQAQLVTTGVKVGTCLAVLAGTYWYGGHSTRTAWSIEKRAAQAAASERLKRDEIISENERQTYEKAIKTINEQNTRSIAAGNRLIARLRNEQGNCAKDSGTERADGKAELPRLNW